MSKYSYKDVKWFNEYGQVQARVFDGSIYLFKQRNSTKAYRLTGGFFDGFAGTITVNKIEAIK